MQAAIRGIVVVAALAMITMLLPSSATATSQWSRKTGLSCNACHTVFPRLNAVGEDFLRNGYQMLSPRKEGEKSEYDTDGGVYLEKVENLLGFRLNMTPFMMETNSFQKDSGSAKESRLTLGSPVWIQFFVAGPIYKDISFFSELEHSAGAFKFNWFYFNLTNVGGTPLANFQVGNISPVEFASYPNRLPQLPNIKGEVFHVKPSNGTGENSTKIRDAHPGIQYFGKHEWALWYAGVSPGKAAASVSQFNEYWGGLVVKMPEDILAGFDGSTATLHYQVGTDTKNTGTQVPEVGQRKNEWTRIVPSVNIRYNEQFDIQAAYMIAEDKNWSLAATPGASFKYSGIALEAGYMPTELWHLGLHYDQYASSDNNTTGQNAGKPVFEYQRIVPAVTYILNYNMRFSLYYEKDLTPDRKDAAGKVIPLIDRITFNVRMMI